MAEKQNIIQKIKIISKNLSKLDKQKLIRREEWGSINFDDITDDLHAIYSNISDLGQLPLDVLSVNYLQKLHNSLSNVSSAIGAINSYSVAEHGGRNVQGHTNKLKLVWAELLQILIQIKPFLILQSECKTPHIEAAEKKIEQTIKDATALNEKLTNIYQDADQTVMNIRMEADELSDKFDKDLNRIKGNFEEKTNSKIQEIEDALKAVKDEVVNQSVTKFDNFYSKEAESYNWFIILWTLAAAILAFMALFFSAYIASGFSGISFSCPINPETKIANKICFFEKIKVEKYPWQLVLPKIAFITVLIGMAVWCGNIAKVLRHQRSVNRHRALSVETLPTFYQSAMSSDAKDIIVTEAARAAFGNVPSGFIKNNDKGGSDAPASQIINLTRDISKTN